MKTEEKAGITFGAWTTKMKVLQKVDISEICNIVEILVTKAAEEGSGGLTISLSTLKILPKDTVKSLLLRDWLLDKGFAVEMDENLTGEGKLTINWLC